MPELPEVETMRRGILRVVGSVIGDVEFVRSRFKKILISPTPAKFRKRVLDQEIRSVGRVGKRVLLNLANECAIVIEPRMTGLVLLADPPDEEHLRVRFGLEGGTAIADGRGGGSDELDESNRARHGGVVGPKAPTSSRPSIMMFPVWPLGYVRP